MAVDRLSAFDPKDKVALAKQIETAIMQEAFWAPFIGSGQNAPIRTYKEDGAGIVTHRLRDLLRGAGVKGNTDFSQNEGKLQFLSQDFEMEIFGHSIRSDDLRIHNYKDDYDFTEQATEALDDWLTDMFDRKIFAALTNDLTNVVVADAVNGITAGGGSDSVSALCGNIGDDDILTVAAIQEALKRARIGVDHNGNRVPPIRPYRVKVAEFDGVPVRQNRYILVVDPFQAQQLKNDPEWKEAQKQAAARGEANNLFTGAIGFIDEAVVVMAQSWSDEYAGIMSSRVDNAGYFSERFEYQPMDIYAGDTGKETSVALLLGATAVGMPMADSFSIYADSTVDMGRKKKIGVDRLLAMAKARFVGTKAEEKASVYHGKDLSCLGIVTRKI